jgi:hypothetical protein
VKKQREKREEIGILEGKDFRGHFLNILKNLSKTY